MKKQIILTITTVFFVSVFAVLRFGSSGAAPATTASFKNKVFPILESRCGNCHMGEFVSAGLDITTYESLMAGSQDGPVIIPGSAVDSLLIDKVIDGDMPKRGPKLTPVQIQTIKDWIDAGAPNN